MFQISYRFANNVRFDLIQTRKVEWIEKVRKTELNDKVQGLLRNGPSVTKFKFPFEISGLKKYIKNWESKNSKTTDTISIGNGFEKNYEIITIKALNTLEKLLESKNEDVKLEAAKELIQFLKK